VNYQYLGQARLFLSIENYLLSEFIKKDEMSKQNQKSNEKGEKPTGDQSSNVRNDVIVNGNGVMLADIYQVTPHIRSTSMQEQSNNVNRYRDVTPLFKFASSCSMKQQPNDTGRIYKDIKEKYAPRKI
jgi:hypothetical protein